MLTRVIWLQVGANLILHEHCKFTSKLGVSRSICRRCLIKSNVIEYLYCIIECLRIKPASLDLREGTSLLSFSQFCRSYRKTAVFFLHSAPKLRDLLNETVMISHCFGRLASAASLHPALTTAIRIKRPLLKEGRLTNV